MLTRMRHLAACMHACMQAVKNVSADTRRAWRPDSRAPPAALIPRLCGDGGRRECVAHFPVAWYCLSRCSPAIASLPAATSRLAVQRIHTSPVHPLPFRPCPPPPPGPRAFARTPATRRSRSRSRTRTHTPPDSELLPAQLSSPRTQHIPQHRRHGQQCGAQQAPPRRRPRHWQLLPPPPPPPLAW
jgi:hypothetical protein